MASSLETNKILAAILTAGIFASGAGVMSRIIYHPEVPAEPSYIIEIAAEGAGEGGDGEVVEDVQPVGVLLASADIGGGESGAKKCVACHSFDEGGANKIGPNLYDIVGRDIASVSGFAYSDALNGIEGAWDYDALDAFLADPKGYAPGTKMAYAGMRDAQDRADLILYLRSLAADPLPLPEAEAVDMEAAEETGGGESEAEATDSAEAPEGDAEEAESLADSTVEAAEDVAEDAADAAGEVAETAVGVVEGVEETAAEVAEATADAASEDVGDAVEETADAAETAAEGAIDEATSGAAAVSETAEAAADQASTAADDAAQTAAGAAVDDTASDAAAGGLVAMIAAGDVAKGEKVSKKCKACHVFEEGGKNKLGPALWGIVGRDIGAAEGFKYSNALGGMDGAWTYENLDQFLAAPKTWLPGTKMVFAGVKKEQDRADLIAYLRSLAAEPAPLN